MSSFDETKPMRRISYLRATNDDYHCDTSAASLANSSASSSIAETLSTKSTTTLSQHIDEHPDPIYDVVGGGSGGADSTSESLDALEDLRLDASCSSRRTSVNSDLRHRLVGLEDLNIMSKIIINTTFVCFFFFYLIAFTLIAFLVLMLMVNWKQRTLPQIWISMKLKWKSSHRLYMAKYVCLKFIYT